MEDKKTDETEATKTTNGRHASQIVGDIMALYATLFHGQIMCNESLVVEEQLSALIASADVLKSSHTKAMAILGQRSQAPAWLVPQEKIESISDMIAKKMVGVTDG